MFKKLKNLLVAITFHYNDDKINNLSIITNDFLNIAKKVKVVIITNNINYKIKQKIIKSLNKKITLEFIKPNYLGHPYLLTWIHLDIFRKYFFKDKNISHFLYLEDDIKITKKNIYYWTKYRKILNKYKLIPSFLRYEINKKDKKKYSVDVLKKSWFISIPKIKITNDYFFVNLPQPYQGMYFLDRILMKAHINGISSHPDHAKHLWNTRERAAQGVTFLSVPKKFISKNVIGYNAKLKKIDKDCLIHHISNTYVNKKDIFSKIPVDDLIRKIF